MYSKAFFLIRIPWDSVQTQRKCWIAFIWTEAWIKTLSRAMRFLEEAIKDRRSNKKTEDLKLNRQQRTRFWKFLRRLSESALSYFFSLFLPMNLHTMHKTNPSIILLMRFFPHFLSAALLKRGEGLYDRILIEVKILPYRPSKLG